MERTSSPNMSAASYRRPFGIFFLALMSFVTLVSVTFFVCIVLIMIVKGYAVIDWDFLFQESRGFGTEGGIRSQIIGTLLLALGAGLLSLPVALGTALYHSEYLGVRFKTITMQLIYALNGVPTILFGLFGYLVFGIYFGLGISWMSGVLILSIMILPTLVVSIRQAIDGIPGQYREAGLALGMTTPQLIHGVIIPQCIPGVVTGLFLGLARAAGETAAIMFTATTFFGVDIPQDFNDPVATLQTHILILTQEAIDPAVTDVVWGSALVLMIIVLCFSATALTIRARMRLGS